ncbi:hypothetical protein OJ997_11895 [Solirubrobacter phytolaccae]|uniref:Uncharacterized protein n=1 Tax=Solirubrobacter phytolaccae TaxID=1404360 RepID=A0A9X3N6Z1_9ACTN|nr:hypothetical protein [Solirubrobacter phytolaccae]MDA0181000.1 hypothetical protein [Solirubrobacter phytolaccae]
MICGPAHVEELARTAQTRVYVQDGVARGCHRGRRSLALGPAKRIVRVYVKGRFVAVKRKTRDGRSLRVYDLRSRRPFGERVDVWRIGKIVLGAGGTAVFFGYEAPEASTSLNDTGIEGYYYGTGYEDAFLRFKGSVIAVREGNRRFRFVGLDTNSEAAELGTLLTHGDVRIDVSRRDVLTLRRGEEAPIELGRSITNCYSASGCFGITSVDIASGRFVASDWNSAAQGGDGRLTVYDLDTRAQREACRNSTLYVLGVSGRVACSFRTPNGGRIEVEGVALDEGPDVDPETLQRFRGRLVWRRGGIEQSAPLP